jgi:hypothetical protein
MFLPGSALSLAHSIASVARCNVAASSPDPDVSHVPGRVRPVVGIWRAGVRLQLEGVLGGAKGGFEEAEEAFLAEQADAERPWIAVGDPCVPVGVHDLEVDRHRDGA